MALSATAVTAAPILSEDFSSDVNPMPNDSANPVDSQSAWFRAAGGSSVKISSGELDMGFRYQATNANYVSSLLFDDEQDYTFSFDYTVSNTQETSNLPSWSIGAGDGSNRTATTIVASGDLSSTSGSVSVPLDPATVATVDGQNIYIRFTKPGALGAGNRSALYSIDNVVVDAVPEPASLGIVSLGGLMLLARRRRTGSPADPLHSVGDDS